MIFEIFLFFFKQRFALELRLNLYAFHITNRRRCYLAVGLKPNSYETLRALRETVWFNDDKMHFTYIKNHMFIR